MALCSTHRKSCWNPVSIRVVGRRLSLWIGLLLFAWVQAQEVNLQIFLTPNPSPYVSDWENTPGMLYVDVFSNSPQSFQIVLEMEIIGQQLGQILQGRSQPLPIPGGNQTLRIDSPDLVDWGSLEYNPQLEEKIARSGRIPEDDYQICVRALRLPEEDLLNEACTNFVIFAPEPPALILPSDGEIVETPHPTFQWSAVQVPPRHPVTYHLKIVPIQEGQPPQDAIDSNIPHHEVDLFDQTLYPYPPDALPFQPGQQYVWQVIARDPGGFPVGENEGRSEIWRFQFLPEAPPPTTPAEEYVVCLIGSSYHILPRSICESLGGSADPDTSPDLEALLPDSIPPAPFDVLWKWIEQPLVILPAPHQQPPKDSLTYGLAPLLESEEGEIVAGRLDVRQVSDTLWLPVGKSEETSTYEWVLNPPMILPEVPDVYEVRGRAVNQNNIMADRFAFLLSGDKKTLAPFLWEQGTEFVLDWERSNRQFQQQVTAVLEPARTWQQERAEKAAEYERLTRSVHELEQIDAGLNPVPSTFRPKIRRLLNALKQIQTPPTPGDIDQAVKEAQARLDACRSKVDRLKKEQQDLEKEKDEVKKKQEEVLRKLDDLFRQHGFEVGGYGFHKDGTAWYGYVSTTGPGFQYGTPGYAEYKNLKSQLRQQNKRAKAISNRLKALPGEIKDAEAECKKLEEELDKLKKIKTRKDLNEHQVQECWRQVRSTLQPLINWCTANPGLCPFKAQLEQLARNCPADEDGWNQFWGDFARVKRAKEQQERALAQQARELKKAIDELDRKIREAEQEAEQKRREAERKARQAAAAAAAAQAARDHQRYLLNNIRELGLITYPGFWETPGLWDWLPSILQVPVGSFLEDRAGIPIPTDVIKAIGGLYNIVGALLDPCTALGMRKTVERLQERINPKTGRKYTLDEALDKTEEMCRLLRKLKALAEKAHAGQRER